MSKKTKYKISKIINNGDYVLLNVGGAPMSIYGRNRYKGKIAIVSDVGAPSIGNDECVIKFIEFDFDKLVRKSWLRKLNKEKAELLLSLI